MLEKLIAQQWLEKVAKPEYRIEVWFSTNDTRPIVGLLDSMRNGRAVVEGVPTISDLGIKTGFDSIQVWSGDREAMLALQKWFESKNFETSGIW